MIKDFYVFVLLSSLLFSTVSAFSAIQVTVNQEYTQEVEKATAIINANQILRLWRNESDQIGVGNVQNVTYKYDKSGAVMTYAAISVSIPLTDSLNSQQIVTVKYPGGQIGNKSIICTINWVGFTNDTIVPPQVFELHKGLSVMFFVNEDTHFLTGYIPYSTSITNQKPSETLLSNPLPTTLIYEYYGYGFRWTNGVHLDWSDFPRSYHLDPDGTPDIAGTDEFNAIHAAFSTWEQDPYSGVDFTYAGTHNYTGWEAYDQDPDGYSVVGWVSDYPNSGIVGLNFWKLENEGGGFWHAVENDIMLNDGPFHWIIGDSLWPWEVDTQSVVTHEVGHTLGLDDIYDASNARQTMKVPYHGVEQRTLEWGDLNGAHYLYPVHADAGSGGDGSNTFSGATVVQKNELYSGRLCRYPDESHTVDTEDYFKFYAVQEEWVIIILEPPDNADFDLELYNPSGNLVAYSRQDGNGVQEGISEKLGASGYWRIRICNTSTNGPEGTGQYSFGIYDVMSRYVASIEYAGAIYGYGGAYYAENLIGSSPDGNYAIVYGYYGAGTIVGCLNNEMTMDSYIYFYGYAWPPWCVVHVYVSLNYDYDWVYVNSVTVYETSPSTIYVGSTSGAYRYIAFAVYSESEAAGIFIDCVIATP